MTKRSTRIQPTTTTAINASGRDLSDLDRQNLEFFQRHNAHLAAFAYHGCKEYGPGAVIVNLTNEATQTVQPPAPVTERLESGLMSYIPRAAWSDASTSLTSLDIIGVIDKIDHYDPNTGVVIVVMREPQSLAAYRIRTVPTPPEAYQKYSLDLSINEALSQSARQRYLNDTGAASTDGAPA